MTVTVEPLYETGHHCKICQRTTIHNYLGPQEDQNGEIILHLWNCIGCGTTVALDSPEEVALRSFRIETRRMRQRRSRRKW